MGSAWKHSLFSLILFVIIINSIYGHPLKQLVGQQDQLIIDDDLTFDDKINVRSVLWPKFCWKVVAKKNDDQYHLVRNQQHNLNNSIKRRRLQRCYPFYTFSKYH